MKRLSIIFSAAMLLLFCSSTVMAQNQSANNSNVVVRNFWFPTTEGIIPCGETEVIAFNVLVHVVVKNLPNGTRTVRYNVKGEGVDSDGGVWTWNNSWGSAWDMSTGELIYYNDNHKIFGPNGEKDRLRVLFVINRNGEVVQDKLEPFCD